MIEIIVEYQNGATSLNVDKHTLFIETAGDMAGQAATQDEINAALARLVVHDVTRPRTARTVRAHLVHLWPLIAGMAAQSPASFDYCITEIAERLAELT